MLVSLHPHALHQISKDHT